MMYNDQRTVGLFASGEMRQYIDGVIASAVREAKALNVDAFEANSNDQIIDHICSKYPIPPLQIKTAEKDVNFVEDRIDARKLPNRLIFDDTTPVYIDSYRVTW